MRFLLSGINGMPKLMCMTRLDELPLDTEDRLSELKQAGGIGYCNITKCCTKVCPENITITDNAIIPLKGARGLMSFTTHCGFY